MLSAPRRLWAEVQKDDVTGLSAELAYRFLLAMFPFFIFLAALGGFVSDWLPVDDPTGEIMDAIGDALPDDAASVFEGQLSTVIDSRSAGLLSFGIIAALWAASGAMKATMKAMNRAYDVEESRPFLRKNAVALGLTVLIGLAAILGIAALTTGQFFAGEIADQVGVGEAFSWFLRIAQWPIAALVLLFGMAFLYWAAPNTGVPFRWISPGALLFVVVWLVMTFGFSLYVANFGNYANTYGALAGVIILLIWLYLTALVMLVGAEVNAMVVRRQAPEALPTEGRREAAPAGGDASRQRRGVATDGGGAGAGIPASAPGARPSRVGTAVGALVAGAALMRAVAETNGSPDGPAGADGGR